MKLTVFPERGFGSNAYLITSGKIGLIIDPGGHEKEILKSLSQQEVSLRYIVNTHGHVDHIMGNQLLKEKTDASLFIHQEDAPMLTDSQKNLSFFLENTGGSLTGPAADSLLEAGDTITLDNYTLTVLHTPGHTPGGISLLGEEILFSGDTIFAQGVGRTDFPGGSMERLKASIQELLTLEEGILVYPGHGPYTTIGRLKKENPFL